MNLIVPISTLPAAGGLSDADLYVVVQGGITKKLTHAALLAAFGGMGGTEDPVSVSVVPVAGTEELTVAALSVLDYLLITGGAGAVKIGTSLGGGEILDETLNGTDAISYPAVGKWFAINTPLYFTGNFTARMFFIKFPS